MTTLKELIDSEPANTSRTNQEVLDWCNELQAIWIDIPSLEFRIWLDSVDGMDKLTVTSIDAGATQEVRSAAILALSIVDSGEPLSFTRSEVRASVAKLAGTGKPFTTTESALLLALGQEQVNRLVVAGTSTKNFGTSLIGSVR